MSNPFALREPTLLEAILLNFLAWAIIVAGLVLVLHLEAM